jgi:hypothetical protein
MAITYIYNSFYEVSHTSTIIDPSLRSSLIKDKIKLRVLIYACPIVVDTKVNGLSFLFEGE